MDAGVSMYDEFVVDFVQDTGVKTSLLRCKKKPVQR